MNPHYHPYHAELASPHPPSPDGGGFAAAAAAAAAQHAHAQHAAAAQHAHAHAAAAHHHAAAAAQHGLQGNGHEYAGQHHPQHNNNNQPPMKQCAGCGGKIVERFLLHALDRYWHHGCLKCSCCGAMLADIGASCFTKGGMILCKNDYARMFGSSGACAACGQVIPANEFVMRTGAPPQHHVFHVKCFACSKCGAHLVTGDRYYMLAGSLVCEQDWHKLVKGAAAAGGAGAAAGGAPVRKGKVGRPRRSRD